VTFSYQVGSVKPEPEIYRLALNSLNVSPEDSIFVGDGGSNELFGAKNVGFTTVMTTEIIGQLWPDKIQERRKHTDYVIDHFDLLTENKAK
jgi:putative hydrolase of the HAD superfamily